MRGSISAYGRMLAWSFAHRAAMLGLAAAVVASAVFLYPKVGKELVPDDDQGEFSINVRLPRGTSYPRTEEFIKPIEKDILALPNVDRVLAQVGGDQANFNIVMTPLETRKMSQQQLMVQARAMLRKYQGARISVSGGTSISGATQRGGPGGGRRKPPEHSHPGPGHRLAAEFIVALVRQGAHGPGRRRRVQQLRADAARTAHRREPGQGGRPRASTSTRWPRASGRSSAAKRCRSSNRATSSIP